MIGKIATGKSFSGCLLYCLNDKQQKQDVIPVMKDRAEVLMLNKCGGSQKELLKQFNEVRQLNTKLAKPVLHITLSFAPGEQLPKSKLIEICEQCAKDMGFENNQYVAIEHKDAAHLHIHIVANRIGFDKRTVTDSNSYKKIA
ncbi:MAG TPA: relaxase/mobilization nuclease domain-containing protein, partial [Panacibacter sp.]|nr:relaxase/mobilization nuclease domain-containing protein [Panacibacter sp.]